VKPIHLNLAARPYRDYRPVYAVVVVMSLLTAFLMLNNVETYYRYIHETRNTRAKIASVEAEAQRERDNAAKVEQNLKSIDVAHLDAQTQFVNAKLAERAFSWSALLDQLEMILIDDVRLVSVTPSFSEDGDVTLALSFQSKSADGLITTLNRMNDDRHFRNPFPSNETQLPDGQFQFTLTSGYVPGNALTTAEVVR
jgi:type IV pilus assembly protein PilN